MEVSGSRARARRKKDRGEVMQRAQESRVKKVAKESDSSFHWDLWLCLALSNWILDFGRPIVALWVPLTWAPLDKPSVGDYFHMAYNVLTPFCLLKLMERTKRAVNTSLLYLCVIVFVMGASIHLVGDSVNHRLIHLGYKNYLSVAENPIMQNLTPKELVHSFQLLYRYDEEIGHLMWYIPFFITLFVYYCGCFIPKPVKVKLSAAWVMLVIISGVYYWYLATEGQIFPLFLFTFILMLLASLYYRNQGQASDVNGCFLLWTFLLAIILTAAWSLWLWNDKVLRQKYQGWLYIPEPWAYYSLYLVPA